MKFSWKMFVSTFLVVLLSLAAGGYFLVVTSFSSSLERETSSAREENRMLQMLLAVQLSGEEDEAVLGTDRLIRAGMENINTRLGNTIMIYRISNRNLTTIYQNSRTVSGNIDASKKLLEEVEENEIVHTVRDMDGIYYIQTASLLNYEDQPIYVETFRDVTDLFSDRTSQFDTFRKMIVVVGSISGILNFFMALWITDPLRKLSAAARDFASGELSARAEINTSDEIGSLADDFNDMADQLENDIRELTQTAKHQEEFIGSFSHELKTPLTSIIGYADMIRSQNLDDETRFMAANYIYSEGKRLEGLSLKLLDLMALRNNQIEFQRIDTVELLKDIAGIMKPQLYKDHVRLKIRPEEGSFHGDKALVKTVIMNLIDNARKAMDDGGRVLVTGRAGDLGYSITVRDDGRGIPAEELERITEAFYMVDKSRSREKGGAGLGLAICQEIVSLHNGSMEFASKVGKGTQVRVLFPYDPSEIEEETPENVAPEQNAEIPESEEGEV